jgi:hypothetical protein
LVEHLLAKQKVAGSNPVSRFFFRCAPVAQLDRAAPFEGEGCRFKSYRAQVFVLIAGRGFLLCPADFGGHAACYGFIRVIAGLPDVARRAKSGRGSAWLERLPWAQEVVGSNPAAPILLRSEGASKNLDFLDRACTASSIGRAGHS